MPAQVMAVGPGAHTRDGAVVPMNVNVGDRVILPDFGGMAVADKDGEDLTVVRDSDLLAAVVIENGVQYYDESM